jgi:hypothetical protein
LGGQLGEPGAILGQDLLERRTRMGRLDTIEGG